MKKRIILTSMILMMFLLVGCHRNDELDKYEGTVMGNGNGSGAEVSDLEEDENSTVEAVFDEKEDVIQKQQKEQKIK